MCTPSQKKVVLAGFLIVIHQTKTDTAKWVEGHIFLVEIKLKLSKIPPIANLNIICSECGRRPARRNKRSLKHQVLLNGVEAQENSWPWMASLRFRANNHHFCGGSIIDQQWILTVAHCVHYRGTDVLLPVEAVMVVLGDHVTTTIHPSERVYFPQQLIPHEDYNHTTLNNDIALIHLNETIEYNDVIAPVCLPTGPPPVGEICSATGWGIHLGNRGLQETTHLNELHLTIVSNEVCGSHNYWGDYITPNMVCAGYRKHGICDGDSGGPLVCNNNGASPYSLVGVTSYVYRHCRNPDGRKPTVFTNVYNYLEWIQTTTTMNCTGYIRSDNGHCYKFVNERMNYTQAEQYCQAEESYLVEIRSQMEQYFLQGLVGFDFVWIGLQNKDQNGNWSYWNSGAPVEYSNGGHGQPNNHGGAEYCELIVNDWWSNGKWFDVNCGRRQKFVCERSCNQAVLASRKCYSFHEERKNYSEAQDMCASMGGHLVEINSEYEQLFLKGIFNIPYYNMECYSDWIWLGLNNQSGDRNQRTWNSGTNITYSNWGSVEESAHKLWYGWQSTNCAVMDSDGQWQESDCDSKLRFLCENIAFTNSSRYVHILCNFDVKEQITADVNRPFPIERGMDCNYICSDDGHCYNYIKTRMNYSAAEEFCRVEGSYLVEIGSQMEQYFLQGLVRDNDVWIGLQDKNQNGNWSHWNSVTPVEYSNWGYDKHDNYRGVQYCGELVNNRRWNGKWNQKWNGKWNDGNCDWKQTFICERSSNQASNMSRKCYSYHEQEKNYVDARETCTSEGGYLLEINSQWEQLFVHEMTNGFIWLDLNDLREEGNWTKWNSGAPVTYSNWFSREPDNGKGVNCGVIMFSYNGQGKMQGKWYVMMGGFRKQFICEQSRHTTSFSRDDSVNNCEWEPNCCSDDTCYTHHDERADCLEAQDICAAEGGYLLEINTEEEQVFLIRWVYLLRYLHRQGYERNGGFSWIGLSDMNEQGNWKKWNSGAPVTYSNWREGQPNNEDQNTKEAEHCTEMMRHIAHKSFWTKKWNDRGWRFHGKWNDLKCDTKRMFVCENTSLTTSSKDIEVTCGSV